jgi:hypothetical protein
MQSIAPLAFVGLAVSSLLTACESMSYGYGYVNRLNEAITIVEHTATGVERSTLPATGRQLPTEGDSVAQRVEIFDAHHRQIGVFTFDDYKRARQFGVPPVLIVSRNGVTLGSSAFWQKMARDWDGPAPSKPVTYGGGDGSSIEKAIIVHASDGLDETLGVYAYMRQRFGYMWTYRSMERYVIPTNDRIIDEYEFVTRDGKKHALYFENRRLLALQPKASNQAMQRTAR